MMSVGDCFGIAKAIMRIDLHARFDKHEAKLDAALEEMERAIVHWYSGSIDILKLLVARGAGFTFRLEV